MIAFGFISRMLKASSLKIQKIGLQAGLSRAKLSTCGIKFEFDSVIRVLQFSCKFAGNFKLAVATFRYFQKYGILGLKLSLVE